MTQIIEIEEEKIDEQLLLKGADIVRKGGTVVFPTETVYGLGANALDKEAVAKIYEAKGRPADNPSIVHISSKAQLEMIVEEIPTDAKILMDAFWPGPLTLLFKKKPLISKEVTGGLDTVAIRMPRNKIALKLIDLSGTPIAAPSANISGKPSPTKLEHVLQDLDGKVDMIIDGGDCQVGLESTVIDLMHDPPMILRPGSITLEDIAKVIDSVIYDPAIHHEKMIPKSPGQKYLHYAPQGEVFVFTGAPEDIQAKIKEEAAKGIARGKKIMILGTDETSAYYKEGIILSLGSRNRPMQISTNLYHLLRKADLLGVEMIYIEGIEENGLGVAIMNRLRKASGGRIIICGGEK